jgi:hypothetical protein
VGQSGGPFSDKRSIPSSQPQTIYPNRSCGTSYFPKDPLPQTLALCYSMLLIPHTPSKLPRGCRWSCILGWIPSSSRRIEFLTSRKKIFPRWLTMTIPGISRRRASPYVYHIAVAANVLRIIAVPRSLLWQSAATYLLRTHEGLSC